jgi:hypothetical protein
MSVTTKQLCARIERSEIDHFESWARFLQTRQGNPFGIDIRRYGDTVALANHDGSLGPLFNRVLGMNEDSLPHLDDILALVSERGTRCRIDISPYQGTPKLFETLHIAGLQPFRFHSFLYATTEDLKPPTIAAGLGVDVRRIARKDANTWASVWLDGFAGALGASLKEMRELSDATALLCEEAGWGLYMATVNGEAASVAALYVQDGMGSLALAGTLPQYRRLGCQTALLQARMPDASAHKCDLIVAQSALGTTSQNNMERAGLKVAYTRAFWLSRV